MSHYEYRKSTPPTPPTGFIILNDSASKTKKHPGYTFLVKTESIDAFWGYGDDTSTVVVKGAYFHVEQSREDIAAFIEHDRELRAAR